MNASASRDPRNQIAAGAFLAFWSTAGWWSFVRTPALWSADYGVDPGPGLLPMIVLTALSAGSLLLIASGLRHAIAGGMGAGRWTDMANGALRPAIFVLTLLIYVSAIRVAGFALASAIFGFAWIGALGASAIGGRGPWLQALVGTAVGVVLIYVVFVYLIRVPL